jgi:GTP cyclohydrolase I
MKQYKTALLALEQDATPNSKQNKFAKIAVESQDEMLKELARRVAKMYGHYIKSGWSKDTRDANGVWSTTIPSNSSQWREMQRLLNTELRTYVEMCIASNKPEWMIMAEKHGWRPMN